MQFWTQTVTVMQSLVTGLGAAFCVLGGITLARGFGDTNGPEQAKGWGQLISGVGIIVIAQTLVPLLSKMF